MAKERGTSNIPMIMGIIGGVLGLPAAVCSAWCGEAIVAVDNIDSGAVSDGSTGGTILLLGILGAILGIVGGALGKKIPTPAGSMMIAAAILTGWNLASALSYIPLILFLLGGVFCFVQKKESIEI